MYGIDFMKVGEKELTLLSRLVALFYPDVALAKRPHKILEKQ
jgi:hypothetical protein